MKMKKKRTLETERERARAREWSKKRKGSRRGQGEKAENAGKEIRFRRFKFLMESNNLLFFPFLH